MERSGLSCPDNRSSTQPLSIYWFGQTIGAHSCAEQVLIAMARLKPRVHLTLRGNPIKGYVEQLTTTARSLGVAEQLQIFPRAEPTEMVRLAGKHDILLGTQPGDELFNQLAIGNKVFTGMMAGLGLALSDTVAHRELLKDIPGCGFLFRDGDIDTLSHQLDTLVRDNNALMRMRLASWIAAEAKFNWEEESKILLRTVNQILPVSRLHAS